MGRHPRIPLWFALATALGVAVATGGLGRAERLSTEVTAPVFAFVSVATRGCAGTYTLDWGDGSTPVKGALPTRKALTFRHMYMVPGEYRLVERLRYASGNPNLCSYGAGDGKLFSSMVLDRRFSCSASSKPRPLWCRQLSSSVRFENPRPISRPPPSPWAYIDGKRPAPCTTAKSCFNRRVEQFTVTFKAVQTTTWTLKDTSGDCLLIGEGFQTLTFQTAKPHPAAIWTQSLPPPNATASVVVTAPKYPDVGTAGPSDRIAFARPSGKVRDLYDWGVQFYDPPLAVKINVVRRMSKTQKCGSEDPFTYRGVGCGTRSGYGGAQVWLPIKALRGPYRFVVGAAFLGPISSRGGGKLDPYPDCVVYPSHRYPDEAALQCLNSSLNRQEGRLVGTPQYDWFDPNELLMIYDTRPYKQTCLTGASPMFDGRALQDCSKKTITVKKPEDDYAFNDTRPDDPNRADDGWTSTTKIAWEFTLKRVGCGKA